MSFGDPPGAGLTPLAVPLPAALVGALQYWTRPGPAGTFLGVALADPVFAFWRGKLFSVAAVPVGPDGAVRLRRAIEAAYGPARASGPVAGVSRLWRLEGVDLVLEQGREEGRARFLVRSRDLSGELARWRDQAVPLEGGTAN